MSHRIVVLALIGLITLCPALCGAGEVAHGPCHESSGGPGDEHRDPTPCPEDRDNCICKGAVPLAEIRVDGLDISLHSSLGPLAAQLASPFLSHHLTADGTPTGLAGWGDSLAVRALLQNFRC